MANNVFANGRELSCKSGDGKTIAAFPDVCFTPPDKVPPTPPGVPIPYPNNGKAKDTAGGSKAVKISEKEVMLRDKSYYKKSTGDEAGKTAKKGLINSKLGGKVYFTSWSMNVKIESQNAVRHLDTTTGNHSSPAANAALPWPDIDSGTFAKSKACKSDRKKEKDACKDYKPHKDPGGFDVCEKAGLSGDFSRNKSTITKRTNSANANPCLKARRCRLAPYDQEPRDGIHGCCPSQSPDHIIPKSSFFVESVDDAEHMPGWDDYKKGKKAPCMCMEGGNTTGSHGLRHAHHKAFPPKVRGKEVAKDTTITFNKQVEHCADGASKVTGCNKKCLEAQLKAGHKNLGDGSDTKYSPSGEKDITPEAVDDRVRATNRQSRKG